jgi:hypothetical protein
MDEADQVDGTRDAVWLLTIWCASLVASLRSKAEPAERRRVMPASVERACCAMRDRSTSLHAPHPERTSMPKFVPQSKAWPADRAVLLVHGIGDASAGKNPFPVAELTDALGGSAFGLAVYTLNYDFINDWAARKLQLAAGLQSLGMAIAARFSNPALAETLAEYSGDVLWPVLHQDTRLAIRDAYMAQLQQIVLDCGETALARGHDPLEYRVSIIAHSLGCYHTYEALHAAVKEPEYRLRPGTDLTQLESVIMMASPVQLIRTIAGDIGALVPAAEQLATLDPAGLSLPSEKMGRKSVPATRKFVAVTGTQDPVGGHLLGKRNNWAFMNIPGQQTEIVQQSLIGDDPVKSLIAALGSGEGLGSLAPDPHSWSAYVAGQAALLTGVLA